MKAYIKRKLIRQKMKKLQAEKVKLIEAVKPIDRQLSKLKQKMKDLDMTTSISYVDHAGGTYQIIENDNDELIELF